MSKKPIFVEISEELYHKLERLIASEKYVSKVDFVRSKLRAEPE